MKSLSKTFVKGSLFTFLFLMIGILSNRAFGQVGFVNSTITGEDYVCINNGQFYPYSTGPDYCNDTEGGFYWKISLNDVTIFQVG